jgi:hypothetical protein
MTAPPPPADADGAAAAAAMGVGDADSCSVELSTTSSGRIEGSAPARARRHLVAGEFNCRGSGTADGAKKAACDRGPAALAPKQKLSCTNRQSRPRIIVFAEDGRDGLKPAVTFCKTWHTSHSRRS